MWIRPLFLSADCNFLFVRLKPSYLAIDDGNKRFRRLSNFDKTKGISSIDHVSFRNADQIRSQPLFQRCNRALFSASARGDESRREASPWSFLLRMGGRRLYPAYLRPQDMAEINLKSYVLWQSYDII